MDTKCILGVRTDRAGAIDALARTDILSLLNLPRSPRNQPVTTGNLNLGLPESQPDTLAA